MNLQDIQLIYQYNYWANRKILEAASNVTQEQFLALAEYPFGGLRGTLLHVVSAECGWRSMFESNVYAGDLQEEDFPTPQSLAERFHEEEKFMTAYLSRLTDEDMNSHLKYTTDEGDQRDRILWHCLLHLVNHGTQHRSEAAAILTHYNVSPGDLDLTLFLNETGRS
jgi:uncharacterized damage-inducible protein DinB